MKVIIYRDKETKKIVRDGGDDYELLKAHGKTDAAGAGKSSGNISAER